MGKVKESLAKGEIISTRNLENPYRPKKKATPDVIESRREKVFRATEGVVPGVTEKVVVKAPIPGGMVKVMALVDYVGMNDIIYQGEVFLLPERRYKSLAFRGYVAEYDGEAPIVDKR